MRLHLQAEVLENPGNLDPFLVAEALDGYELELDADEGTQTIKVRFFVSAENFLDSDKS